MGLRSDAGAILLLLASLLAGPLAADDSQPEAAEAIFNRTDVTEDGFLSGKEAAPFKRFDANADGRITKTEFLSGYRKEQSASPKQRFAALDVNEDGRLTGTEMVGVAHLDKNQDGRITQEEFQGEPLQPKAIAEIDEPVQQLRPATDWDKKLSHQFEAGKRWAVVIGVNRYSTQPLRFCVPDAKLLAEALVQRCGYEQSRVVLLTDDQEDRNRWPNKLSIQSHVSETLKLARPNDTVLVFFAGHGFTANGQSFLCPLDHNGKQLKLSGWRLDELRTMLHDCQAAQKILVLDCCHSGGAVTIGVTPPSSDELNQALEHAQGLITLASCRTNQTSLESVEKGHGLFTQSFVHGLQGGADFDTNGVVDSDEIYRHVLMEVPVAADQLQKGHKQTPVRIIGQDVVGIFALARPNGHLPPQADNPPEPTHEPAPGDRIVNTLGMKLVHLPSRLFAMGSPGGEYLRNPDERIHPAAITIRLWMGMHEVTQHDYQRVMGSNPSYFSTDGEGAGAVAGVDTGKFPVEQVSWTDAMEFCRRLSALPEEVKAGRKYRLPTEAEWEFACRGGTVTAFHTGDLIDGRLANIRGDRPYWNAKKTPYLARTRTVGSYAPNGFGLHDMHGNVAEWCADWYSPTTGLVFPSSLSIKSPADTLLLMEEFVDSEGLQALLRTASNPSGPKQGDERVIRGGAYSSDVTFCRSAARRYQKPEYRYRTNGFRIVCTVEKKQ